MTTKKAKLLYSIHGTKEQQELRKLKTEDDENDQEILLPPDAMTADEKVRSRKENSEEEDEETDILLPPNLK